MDSPPPEPPLLAPKRKRSRAIFIALVALILLAVAILALLVPHSSDEKMTWLTPAQMARAKQTGLLTRLKYKLEWFIGPFRRFFYRKKPLLQFEASIFNLTNASPNKILLESPVSTNADGTLAWILSPDQLVSFRQRLKSLLGPYLPNSMTVITADGMQAQMTIGYNVRIGGVLVPVGSTVYLIPKASGDLFKLFVQVTDTETNMGSANSLSLKTNLAVACRASIPNGGALVIDGGNTGGKDCWLLLTPVLTDAKGKPIKR